MNSGTNKNEKSLIAHSETAYTPHWICTCLLPYIAEENKLFGELSLKQAM
jgi:hypothetical protein